MGITDRTQWLQWRAQRLLSAGFDPELADRLAGQAEVDLHALLELIDRGCPPHLAARILAPLDDLLDAPLDDPLDAPVDGPLEQA
jgi:hypothetical protein